METLATEMDISKREQFAVFMQRATAGSNTDDNYIELYNILLRSATPRPRQSYVISHYKNCFK